MGVLGVIIVVAIISLISDAIKENGGLTIFMKLCIVALIVCVASLLIYSFTKADVCMIIAKSAGVAAIILVVIRVIMKIFDV